MIAVADDWSYPHASIYGTRWVVTPNFDRVAREGVLFTNAYTPVAKCSASRATLLTGRYPWQNGAGFTHFNFFPPDIPTFPEVLKQTGYATGVTGKGWGPGKALTSDGKPRYVAGTGFHEKKLHAPTAEMSSVDYAANFADFLNQVPTGTPWFFWYGGIEPHRPYAFKSGTTLGGKNLAAIDKVPRHWPDLPDVREDMLDYAYEVEHFDSQLGKILQKIERRGELDNTIVIVTSDNGMPFPRSKGQNYELSCHIPMAVRWPAGIPAAGRVVDDYVSFADVAPTLIASAQVQSEEQGITMTGRSFLNVLRSSKDGRVDPERNHVLLGRERHDPGRPNNAGYPIRGMIVDGWLYLYNFTTDRWPAGNPETGYLDVDDGPTKRVLIGQGRSRNNTGLYWSLSFGTRPADELYDLANDPDCVTNLAPYNAKMVAELRNDLFSRLRAQADPRLTGSSGDYFDRFPFARSDDNDFYEKWSRGELPLPPYANPDPGLKLPISEP